MTYLFTKTPLSDSELATGGLAGIGPRAAPTLPQRIQLSKVDDTVEDISGRTAVVAA
jgi:hypothetical protein